jgi:hypothetical protein
MEKLAERLAHQTDITCDRLASVSAYLKVRLRKQIKDQQPVNFAVYRNMRIIELALKIRNPKRRHRWYL